jgi:hypothetical protein
LRVYRSAPFAAVVAVLLAGACGGSSSNAPSGSDGDAATPDGNSGGSGSSGGVSSGNGGSGSGSGSGAGSGSNAGSGASAGSGSSVGSGSNAGSGSGTSSGSPSSGSPTDAGPLDPDASAHRPQAAACPTTPLPIAHVSCQTSADCQDGGGIARWCRNSACSPDQCLTDTDCPTGSACGCASMFGGNAIHTNMCVESGCRVDADCPSGLCSPAYSGYCGGFTGYHCRSAADTCSSDADCKSTEGGFSSSSCRYEATVGHWQCAPIIVCMG